MTLELISRGSKSPKPSCSYHCMIGMALQASPSGKLPVNEIYKYILNRFPYFRTAADNWKNSVRHCLSLGQCFHKVTQPGAFPHKKGFHWQVASDKLDIVNQEIFKYLTATGQAAENYGIPSSKLGSGKAQLLTHGQNTPPLPNINLSTVSPSLGLVGLQLSQTDLKVLHKLGQPLTPSLSPYDYNLLINPNMQHELNTIVSLIRGGGSLVKFSQEQVVPKTTAFISDINSSLGTCNPSPGQYNIPLSHQRTPQASSCKERMHSSVNCFKTPHTTLRQAATTTPQSLKFPLSHSPPKETNISIPSMNLKTRVTGSTSSSSMDTQRINEVGTNCLESVETSNLESKTILFNQDVDYSDKSPTEFIAEYPSSIERVERDIFADDLDSSYPFICSEEEHNGDISLSQLHSEDWEDTEEPINSSKKTHTDLQCFAFNPVEGDWNSWREPSYIERINALVQSITTQVSVVVDDSLYKNECQSQPSSSLENEKDQFKHGKRAQEQLAECKAQEPTRNCLKKRKMKTNTRRKQRQPTNTQSTPQNTKTKAKDPRPLHPFLSLKVSIPFVKLVTSRQVKKYCNH